MVKRTLRRTVCLVGLVALPGLLAVLVTDTAKAQCGCGPRYGAAPYQPQAYVYRARVPQRGCYPYYGAPVAIRQYAAAAATLRPAPNGRNMSPAEPHAHPAPNGRDMAPAKPHVHPLAEAVAPPDLPSPVPSNTQTLAEKQRICPVTGERLGSMGKPYKVHVKGRDVLLCCQGCESRFMRDPEKYLAKLNP